MINISEIKKKVENKEKLYREIKNLEKRKSEIEQELRDDVKDVVIEFYKKNGRFEELQKFENAINWFVVNEVEVYYNYCMPYGFSIPMFRLIEFCEKNNIGGDKNGIC